MKPGITTKKDRQLRLDRKNLSYYRDVALIGLGAFLIIGIASQFDQWLKERTLIHLEFSGGLSLVICAFFVLIPNRMLIAIGSLALVVLLGVVSTIVNRTLVALPLTIICALVVCLLIRWKGSTINPE
jgi:formate/nitrite transporter FocA (FNT family)